MWIFLVILLLLLLLLMIGWLLWARMAICINSYQHQYYLRFGGLIRIEPVEKEHQLLVSIKVPFFRFHIDPFKGREITKKSKRKIKEKKSTGEKGRKLAVTFYLKTALDALKTFTIRRFHLDLDTNDYVLNAKLIPVMMALSRGPAQLQINYMGNTNLWIEIDNQMVRFVPLAFRFIRKKYF